MKTFITLIISIVYASSCFAQDLFPAFDNEVTYSSDGQTAYYNGSPFTGIVVDSKTKKTIGEYRNGKRNGLFTDKYPSGKKQSEGKYITGIKEGLHKEWYENGNKKTEAIYANGILNGQYTEWAESGEVTADLIYQYGNIIKSSYYKNGVMDGLWVSYDGATRKETTYKEGSPVSEGIFSNNGLDGKRNEYITAQKIRETTYQNGVKISEGILNDGKQDGKWVYYSNNGGKITEKNYVDGELMNEEVKITANLLSNFPASSGTLLFKTRGVDNVFFAFDFKLNKNDSYTNAIVSTIKSNLANSNRIDPVTSTGRYKDESINYFIECSNVYYTTESMVCQNLKGEKFNSYKAYTSATFNIKDAEKKNIDNISISGSKECASSTTEAFNSANNGDYTFKMIKRFFPVRTIITGIAKRNNKGEVETVSLDGGDNIGIFHAQFMVYDEQWKRQLGKLKSRKIDPTATICKIIEGEDLIISKLEAGEKLKVVSIIE